VETYNETVFTKDFTFHFFSDPLVRKVTLVRDGEHIPVSHSDSIFTFSSLQIVCLFTTGLKKAKIEGKKCQAKTMKSKKSRQNS
jgi:hypothetical protein